MKRTAIIAAIMLGTHLIGFNRMEAQAIRMSKGTVFQDGKITVGEKFLEVESHVLVSISVLASEDGLVSAFTNQAFACTPVRPLKKGDVLDADVSSFEAWSKEKTSLLVGTNKETADHPVLGLVLGDTGVEDTIIPVRMEAKVDMKPGVPTRSKGWIVEANRAVKAGDTISAVFISACLRSPDDKDKLIGGYAILSVEKNSKGNPWFTAFQEHLPSAFRTHATADWKKVLEQLQ
jgi:hypothetical protein